MLLRYPVRRKQRNNDNRGFLIAISRVLTTGRARVVTGGTPIPVTTGRGGGCRAYGTVKPRAYGTVKPRETYTREKWGRGQSRRWGKWGLSSGFGAFKSHPSLCRRAFWVSGRQFLS